MTPLLLVIPFAVITTIVVALIVTLIRPKSVVEPTKVKKIVVEPTKVKKIVVEPTKVEKIVVEPTKVEKCDLYRKELKANQTYAEKIFGRWCKRKGINVWSQYYVWYKDYNYNSQFYICDFCDVENKIIFEIDGGYHNTAEQIVKDRRRDIILTNKGFKVCRITNEQVYNGDFISIVSSLYKNL